jgi:FMN phosphatase YigB (HAD superfamily)
MKNILAVLVALCGVCLMQHADAEVRETMTMADIETEITPDTLLVFDLDNTLIEPMGNLGSDQWYFFLIRKFETVDHAEHRVAEERAVRLWDALQEQLTVKPVEDLTPLLIRRQQDRGIRTMGLTAREPEVATATLKQLASVGIDLARNTVTTNGVTFEMNAPATLKDGVLFIGENNSKGPALTNLLARLAIRPAKIVYADDKKKHVDSLERACGAAAIPYAGFRYGATDAKVNQFNHDTADLTLFLDGVHAAP